MKHVSSLSEINWSIFKALLAVEELLIIGPGHLKGSEILADHLMMFLVLVQENQCTVNMLKMSINEMVREW